MRKNALYLLSFTLIFLLIFNGPILLKDFINYKSMVFLASLEILKSCFYLIIALFGLFFGLSINRYLFLLGSFLLFFICSGSIYYISEFAVTISPEFVKVFFYNEATDALELISMKLILWTIFVLSTWFFLIRKYSKELSTPKPLWCNIIQLVFLVISINLMVQPPYKLLKHFLPWQVTNSVSLFLKKAPGMLKIDISKNETFENKNKEDLVTVLIIGEAARYDHFGINGYERDTTPFLSKQENIFSFDATSCGSLTYTSVSCMLSKHAKNAFDINKNETTLVSLFNKLGFGTAWFGTQNLLKYFEKQPGGSFYNEAKILIIPGGSALYKMNEHDEIMLPFIEDYLKKDGNKFIVIHTSGSHWDYARRYTKDFEKFKPGCAAPLWNKRDQTDCSKEGLISIYDNSILYTDYFISKVIELIKDRNSFLIYSSDHGESLGEGGRYAHGTDAPEQLNIPFIFWGSPKYFENHKSIKDALLSRKNEKISHDYLFHSLLGCSNIDSTIIDQTLNICAFR